MTPESTPVPFVVPHEQRKVPIEKLMGSPTPELRTAIAVERLHEVAMEQLAWLKRIADLLETPETKAADRARENNKGKRRG